MELNAAQKYTLFLHGLQGDLSVLLLRSGMWYTPVFPEEKVPDDLTLKHLYDVAEITGHAIEVRFLKAQNVPVSKTQTGV